MLQNHLKSKRSCSTKQVFDRAFIPARSSSNFRTCNKKMFLRNAVVVGFLLSSFSWPVPANADDFDIRHVKAGAQFSAYREDIQENSDGSFHGFSSIDTLESGHFLDDLLNVAKPREVLLVASEGARLAVDALRIRDFNAGLDRIRVAGGLSFADITISDDDLGNVILFDTANNQYIAIVDNTSATSLTEHNFIFSAQ